jgi:hypothetical protein
MAPDGKDEAIDLEAGAWIAERDGAWAPDGKSIAFAADSNGQFDLWIAPASGGGAPKKLTSMAGDERWPSWTRDGQIVFSHRAPKGVWQLFAMKADGSSEPVKLTPDDSAEWQGAASPDGKLVAYQYMSGIGSSTDTSDVGARIGRERQCRGHPHHDNGQAPRVIPPGRPTTHAWRTTRPDRARVAACGSRRFPRPGRRQRPARPAQRGGRAAWTRGGAAGAARGVPDPSDPPDSSDRSWPLVMEAFPRGRPTASGSRLRR